MPSWPPWRTWPRRSWTPSVFPEDHLADLREERAHPFRTERVSLTDLTAHPRNYQEHPPDQLDEISRSLDLHGFYRNIIPGTAPSWPGTVWRPPAAPAGPGSPWSGLDASRRSPGPSGSWRRTTRLVPGGPGRPGPDGRTPGILEADGDLAGTGYDEAQLVALVMVTRPASEIRDHDSALRSLVPTSSFTPEDPLPWALVVRTATAEQREEVCRLLVIGCADEDGPVPGGRAGEELHRPLPWSPWRTLSLSGSSSGPALRRPRAVPPASRQPRYPVYVPSKGRGRECLTARFLTRDHFPFYLVFQRTTQTFT